MSNKDTPEALLSRLCSYYLECLSLDDESGVSVFADSRQTPDYIEVPALPTQDGALQSDAGKPAAQFIQQLSQSNGRKVACVGYPIRLRKHVASTGWEGFFVEPIFLYPLAESAGQPGQPLHLGDDPPSLNPAMLKAVCQGGPAALVEEAAELTEELGMWNTESPELAALAAKICELRPDWDWQEPITTDGFQLNPAIRELKVEGIYNRAVIVGVERSKYTQGLEKELAKLESIEGGRLSKTALGYWLAGAPTGWRTAAAGDDPLLEPIPLNAEQRAAVESALLNPLTVVTGPPGTGKSQVVSALLINAAKRGMRVLFASRNNKAVDVVEARVNRLGPRPVLLRLGRGAYQEQLAQYIAAVLGSQTTNEDMVQYEEAQTEIRQLEHEIERCSESASELIKHRNDVDELEQRSEEARIGLGNELFARAAIFDPGPLTKAADRLSSAVERADRSTQSGFTRLLWIFIGKSRLKELGEVADEVSPTLGAIGIQLPAASPSAAQIPAWRASLTGLAATRTLLDTARNYHARLRALSSSQPLVDVHRQILSARKRLATASMKLWDAWIRMAPVRLSQEDRSHLGNFLSIIQLIVQADQQKRRAGTKVFSEYYRTFPKISKILNCWAVTSLSASGRVPLDPGFFDLVIIDEASQCDIASALPLLYRAKRAVIIGDPQQLKHISTIPASHDTNLLIKQDLLADHAKWGYSTTSLYGLASSLVGPGSVTKLLDHHRSHAAIIGFSNAHFYQGRLRVATRYNDLHHLPGGEPAVRWIQVPGRVRASPNGGTVNRREAEAVINELERLILEVGYRGTVGVVTPFRGQANLLTRLLNEHRESSRLRHGTELLCESAHRFQGDERDVMIFSPVVAEGIGRGAIMFLQKTGNIFNVAITRARAALIVIGDAGAASSSGIDYLAKFAAYARQPNHREEPLDHDAILAGLSPTYPVVARPESVSDWERYLYGELYRAGHRAIPQYQVEKFTLDFALFAGDRRLNIEVDGERYHKAWNGELLYRDQLRNMRLIELGWDVMRFWVYEIRDAPDECIRRVKDWMAGASEYSFPGRPHN